MKLSELTEQQYRAYFENRLSQNKLRKSGRGFMALCCFHNDSTPSLSISMEKGVWKCHSGCGSGGVLDFEMKFSSCDKETAIARIAEIIGESHLNLGQQPEAIYPYTDAFGKLLFQVVRYPGKRFTQRRPKDDGGWEYKTQGMKMVLYNLPDVVAARNLLVVEGEKCADYVRQALPAQLPVLAVTTSPRGAGKWLDEFGAFSAGKQVLIVEDNDEAGRNHAQAVARSCHKWAQGVKIMRLTDMPEHSGCDDFIAKHGVQEFLARSKSLEWWQQPIEERSLFLSVSDFMAGEEKDGIDWLVEGVVQRGANGMVIARPKSGKSFAILDLAIALASGQKWLDFYVEKKVRTALVSREDYAGLTRNRYKKLAAGRNLTQAELDGWLYINAKGIKPKIMLDYPEDVANLITDLKRYHTEFLIMDVMRVLHGADENDNTEMQKVIDVLNRIQDATGASLCLVHHDNKREDATITERVRGASGIAGWAEFICHIESMEDEEHTRKLACDLKAAMIPLPFFWRILDTPEHNFELKRVHWEPPSRSRKKKTAEEGAPF
jgi:AAA domain-containing protein/CHC2-type zinc finger protein